MPVRRPAPRLADSRRRTTRRCSTSRAAGSRTSVTPSIRARDGSLYAEELFGVEGFVGRSSLLYHRVPPTRTHRIEPLGAIQLEEADDGVHRHRLINSAGLPPKGDVVTGRVPLFFNADLTFGVVRPAEPMPETVFYRNGEADELLFVHEGKGRSTASSGRSATARVTTS